MEIQTVAKGCSTIMDPILPGVLHISAYLQANSLPRELLDWCQVNCRRYQDIKTDIAKMLPRSLLENESFHLLNGGIFIHAEDADIKDGKLYLTLSDPDLHGIYDGGHTLRTLIKTRNVPENRYVKADIIVGLTDPLMTEISVTRKIIYPADPRSLADRRNVLQPLKDILAPLPFSSRIEYRANDVPGGRVRVDKLISIMLLYYKDTYEKGLPKYKGPNDSLEYFLRSNNSDLIVKKTSTLIPELFLLWDRIECTLPQIYGEWDYEQKTSVEPKRNRISWLYEHSAPYNVSDDSIYPLMAGFSALITENEDGRLYWKEDPIKVWDQQGLRMAEILFGDGPNKYKRKIADRDIWLRLYQLIAGVANMGQ